MKLPILRTLSAIICFGQLRDNRDKTVTCDQCHCTISEQTVPSLSRWSIDAGSNGGVTVRGWTGKETLVRSKIEAWANIDSGAGLIASQVHSGSAAGTIRPSGPETRNSTGRSVSYAVFVPHATDQSLTTHGGGITASDSKRRLDIRTTNGGVHVELDGDSWTSSSINLPCSDRNDQWQHPLGLPRSFDPGRTAPAETRFQHRLGCTADPSFDHQRRGTPGADLIEAVEAVEAAAVPFRGLALSVGFKVGHGFLLFGHLAAELLAGDGLPVQALGIGCRTANLAEGEHLHMEVATGGLDLKLVAEADVLRRLGGLTVGGDPAQLTSLAGEGSGLKEAGGPEPFIDSHAGTVSLGYRSTVR